MLWEAFDASYQCTHSLASSQCLILNEASAKHTWPFQLLHAALLSAACQLQCINNFGWDTTECLAAFALRLYHVYCSVSCQGQYGCLTLSSSGICSGIWWGTSFMLMSLFLQSKAGCYLQWISESVHYQTLSYVEQILRLPSQRWVLMIHWV